MRNLKALPGFLVVEESLGCIWISMDDVIRTLALKMLDEMSREELNILICEKYLQEAYESGRGSRK